MRLWVDEAQARGEDAAPFIHNTLQLLKQYREARKMMRMMTGGLKKGGLKRKNKGKVGRAPIAYDPQGMSGFFGR